MTWLEVCTADSGKVWIEVNFDGDDNSHHLWGPYETVEIAETVLALNAEYLIWLGYAIPSLTVAP